MEPGNRITVTSTSEFVNAPDVEFAVVLVLSIYTLASIELSGIPTMFTVNYTVEQGNAVTCSSSNLDPNRRPFNFTDFALRSSWELRDPHETPIVWRAYHLREVHIGVGVSPPISEHGISEHSIICPSRPGAWAEMTVTFRQSGGVQLVQSRAEGFIRRR